MSGTNEIRHIEWHKTCKCLCRLDRNICNNKQRRNENKCRCECKELIDKGMCDEGFIWNTSNCKCECDKLCDVGEYLDHKNCKRRTRLIDKLVEECSENIDGNKMLYNETLDVISLNTVPLNVYKKECGSCTLCMYYLLYFIKSICVSSFFIYFYWYLNKDNFCVKLNPSIQITIY